MEVSSSYLQKCGIFSRGNLIEPVVLECCERAHSDGNEVIVPFLNDPKYWRAPRPPATLIIFPKSPDQNSEIAILFSIVEKPYNYVFGDDLLPQNPRGRGYKLQTLTSAFPWKNLSWRKKNSMKGAQEEGATSYKLWPVLFHGGICHGGRKIPWRERRIF